MTSDFLAEPEEYLHATAHEWARSLRAGILVTLAAIVAWASLTLLYLAFWAPQFTLFQSIAVLLVSLLSMFGVIAGAWISFGVRHLGDWFD